jgi:hypothetical protein
MKIETRNTINGDFDEVQVEAGEFVWLNDGLGKLVSVSFSKDHLSITSYGPSPVSFPARRERSSTFLRSEIDHV